MNKRLDSWKRYASFYSDNRGIKYIKDIFYGGPQEVDQGLLDSQARKIRINKRLKRAEEHYRSFRVIKQKIQKLNRYDKERKRGFDIKSASKQEFDG